LCVLSFFSTYYLAPKEYEKLKQEHDLLKEENVQLEIKIKPLKAAEEKVITSRREVKW
jgi:hypothetical protein